MRLIWKIGLAFALLFSPLTAPAQEELAPVATLHLADGTSVALLQWKLSYDFSVWRQKESIASARTVVRERAQLLLGRKDFPVRGDTLSIAHVEASDSVRVSSMRLKKAGELKVEPPARDVLAPELAKNLFYQPLSLDISGKTLSGMDRSFCVASFSALVDCGSTKASRVVGIDFN
jgi:hypothetical protein